MPDAGEGPFQRVGGAGACMHWGLGSGVAIGGYLSNHKLGKGGIGVILNFELKVRDV